MNYFLLAIGIAINVIITWDVFLTVLTFKGSGPITNIWCKAVWKISRKIHGFHPIHRGLSLVGPILLVTVVLIWYFSIYAGWLIIFASQDASIVSALSGASSNFLEKLYFTGVTIGSLGYGDFVPKSFPWTTLSSLASLQSTLIISTAISYSLPVISAAIQKKTLASNVSTLGSDEALIFDTVYGGAKSDAMRSHILGFVTQYNTLRLQYQSYPILAYFHSADLGNSINNQTLRLYNVLERALRDKASTELESTLKRSIDAFVTMLYQQQCGSKKKDRLSDAELPDTQVALAKMIERDGW